LGATTRAGKSGAARAFTRPPRFGVHREKSTREGRLSAWKAALRVLPWIERA
jgi:hypothetical protein